MHFSFAAALVLFGISLITSQPSHFGDNSCSANEAFLHNGFFYQFFDCPTTWQNAEDTCKNGMRANGRNVFGGHLVSILDQDESEWLKFHLNQRYGRQVGVWIGMKRDAHLRFTCPNPTQWTDGNTVFYTNYLDQQPNCFWEGEDCFHLYDNGHWNDAECQDNMRFVCKVRSSEGSHGESITDVSHTGETTTLSEIQTVLTFSTLGQPKGAVSTEPPPTPSLPPPTPPPGNPNDGDTPSLPPPIPPPGNPNVGGLPPPPRGRPPPRREME